MQAKQHILLLSPDRWRRWLGEQGEPAYRADQILDWLFRKWVVQPSGMSNLSRSLRDRMDREFHTFVPPVIRTVPSSDRKTTRTAFTLEDGCVVESVLMRSEGHSSFCISSQAGCALGCRFCATARAGFRRNLTAPEILGQALHLARMNGGMGNIVFMGMGEPLLNMGGLLPALETLVDTERFALGRRRITVSTAGIVAGIQQLARHRARPNLALSLNSPFHRQRGELMPVNARHPLEDVLKACAGYVRQTGRRLMIEYVLLGGINTSAEAARELVSIARRLDATVNLIPFNPFPGSGYTTPSREEIAAFRALLEQNNVIVTQRFRRGTDIAAGCGQLSAAVRADTAR